VMDRKTTTRDGCLKQNRRWSLYRKKLSGVRCDRNCLSDETMPL
jgi:hypothetical protein